MDDWDKTKQKLMKNPAFRREYEASRPEFEIARAIIRARIKNKLTQAQLAKKLKTRQSVISRFESMNTTPSLSFLKRLAAALNLTLRIEFS
jgi:ribosome-binding protein aMBF1 (putative translation factor)